MDNKQFNTMMDTLSLIHMAILAAESHRMGMTPDDDYKDLLNSLMVKTVKEGLERAIELDQQ